MADDFDPYRKWLGIPADEQPPNYYRLLGVGLYENDAETIATAADRQMGHLRTFQTGPHSALSQKLLNECAAARICLLNAERKAAYDRELRSKAPPSPHRPPLPKPPPASVTRAMTPGPTEELSDVIAPLPGPPRAPNPAVPPSAYAMRPPPPRRRATSTGRRQPASRQKWKPAALIWLGPLGVLAGAALVGLLAVSSRLGGDRKPAGPAPASPKEAAGGPLARVKSKARGDGRGRGVPN